MTVKKGNKIKVAFVNTPPIYKEGLRVVLKKSCKIKVVGEGNTNKHLLKFIAQKKPDILLIDVCSINTSQLQILSSVICHYPKVRSIILSSNTDDQFIAEVMIPGIQGFIAKDSDSYIIKAIKDVCSGNMYFSPALVAKIERVISEEKACAEKEGPPSLTKTEETIIQFICHEMSNKEIARKLFLSVRTIEGYRTRILQKIKAKGTIGIVVYALQAGILSLDF